MFNKHIVSVIAVLFLSASAHGRGQGIEKEKVTGAVVAYDVGLGGSGGSCWQHLIVRTGEKDRQKYAGEYLVVRYESSCMRLIPERVLKRRQRWTFSMTRSVSCDQTIGDLLYLTNVNPEGGSSRTPLLKFVPGEEAERISKAAALPCYVLKQSEFEAPLKQRLITGMVVRLDGRPIIGAEVRLRYDDAFDYLLVNTDDQGRFEIPIYEGFNYVLQAGKGNRGQKVKIAVSGEIKPLRLVI
ncbi:MAG: hypothetical protein AABO41_24660 [Acidobacteriota bacterium]